MIELGLSLKGILRVFYVHAHFGAGVKSAINVIFAIIYFIVSRGNRQQIINVIKLEVCLECLRNSNEVSMCGTMRAIVEQRGNEGSGQTEP